MGQSPQRRNLERNPKRSQAQPPDSPAIGDGDRLSMTFFLAAVLHGILILGVTFSLAPQADENPPALDIILVQTSTPAESEDAKFLAQVSQQGGGDSTENIRPQDLFTAPHLTAQPGMALQTSKQTVAHRKAVEQQQLLLASTSDYQISSDEVIEHTDKQENNITETTQQNAQTARLAQELNTRIETGSSADKVKFLNSSTKEFAPARYMREWINHVERIGNLNYPDQARRNKLSGTLILDVVISADGKLVKTDLRRSSGHKVLDDAARRIVRLAAPYSPFPSKLKKQADVIHITRSWEFLSNNQLKTF